MYMTAKELTARGWDEKMIFKYLGDPDALKRSQYQPTGYAKGKPTRGWLKTRIAEAEQLAEFQDDRYKVWVKSIEKSYRKRIKELRAEGAYSVSVDREMRGAYESLTFPKIEPLFPMPEIPDYTNPETKDLN
jgi:hypothetical protein